MKLSRHDRQQVTHIEGGSCPQYNEVIRDEMLARLVNYSESKHRLPSEVLVIELTFKVEHSYRNCYLLIILLISFMKRLIRHENVIH